jgi:diguanylate cyclase (GGDEF)-like protein/PAS domain S-box-containing protein
MLLIVMQLGQGVSAQEKLTPVNVNNSITSINLMEHSQWLVADNRVQLSDIQELTTWRNAFSPQPLNANQSLWGKVTLSSESNHTSFYISIDNPRIDALDIYVLDERDRIINSYRMGTTRVLGDLPIEHRLFVVPVDIPYAQPRNIYIKVRDKGPLVFAFKLNSESALLKKEQRNSIIFSLISGALAMMVLYFLVTYTLLRSPVRFWFSVASTAYLLLFLNSQGVVSYLSGFNAYIDNISTILCALLVFSLAKVTFTIFRPLPTYYRYFLYAMGWLSAAAAFVFNSYQQILLVSGAGMVTIGTIAVLAIFYRYKGHNISNRVFALGLTLIALTTTSHIGLYLNWIAFPEQLSLTLSALIIIGIVLIAVAIAAHEKVIAFRHYTQQQDTIHDLQQFVDMFEDAPEGRFITSLNGELLRANRAMAKIFGYEDVAQMKTQLDNLSSLYAEPNDRELLLGELHKNRSTVGKEIKGKTRQNQPLWLLVSAQLSHISQREEKVIFGSILDISTQKSADKNIEYMASHDTLTGFYQRQEFEKRLHAAISLAEQQQDELTLLHVNIDQFKAINDTYGHKAGDAVLKQFSQLLLNIVSIDGLIGRLGGDEFGILLSGSSAQNSFMLANKLLNTVQNYDFSWEERRLSIGISIGQVSWNDKITNSEQLLSMADSACYMAKTLGRNRLHTYSSSDKQIEKYESQLSWLPRIQHALTHNGFELHMQSYMPMTSIAQGHHYEILLRLVDEHDQRILPNEFLPAAERYNLSAKIDRWVIDTYFTWLNQNPQHKEDLVCCNINLSGYSLGHQDLKLFILSAFEKYQVPYNKICFEITESMAILKLDETIEFINTFKALGCIFALDDFGSGFSSYNYLKNLPVDQVKIDGAFVKSILIDPVDMAMVKSIKDIASAMNIQTIAEYVESKEIMVELGKIGVDFVQGFGVDKPTPLSSMDDEN